MQLGTKRTGDKTNNLFFFIFKWFEQVVVTLLPTVEEGLTNSGFRIFWWNNLP